MTRRSSFPCRAAATFAACLIAACASGKADDGTPAPKPERAAVAPPHKETDREAFSRLVRNHPSKAVRDIAPLLDSGTISFATDYRGHTPTQMVGAFAGYLPGEQVFLFDPGFLTDPDVPECTKLVVIRHETKHFQDDMEGRYDLKRGSSHNDSERAFEETRRVFRAEWRAKMAELEMRQTFSCPSFDAWQLDDTAMCAYFKKLMLESPKRLPTGALARSPKLRRWIKNLRCTDLARD